MTIVVQLQSHGVWRVTDIVWKQSIPAVILAYPTNGFKPLLVAFVRDAFVLGSASLSPAFNILHALVSLLVSHAYWIWDRALLMVCGPRFQLARRIHRIASGSEV